MKYNKMTFKQLEKYQEEIAKRKVKCKCGHTVVIRYNEDKKLCTWCNHYVYSPRIAFKEKLGEMINGR